MIFGSLGDVLVHECLQIGLLPLQESFLGNSSLCISLACPLVEKLDDVRGRVGLASPTQSCNMLLEVAVLLL